MSPDHYAKIRKEGMGQASKLASTVIRIHTNRIRVRRKKRVRCWKRAPPGGTVTSLFEYQPYSIFKAVNRAAPVVSKTTLPDTARSLVPHLRSHLTLPGELTLRKKRVEYRKKKHRCGAIQAAQKSAGSARSRRLGVTVNKHRNRKGRITLEGQVLAGVVTYSSRAGITVSATGGLGVLVWLEIHAWSSIGQFYARVRDDRASGKAKPTPMLYRLLQLLRVRGALTWTSRDRRRAHGLACRQDLDFKLHECASYASIVVVGAIGRTRSWWFQVVPAPSG
ncbi:hypothetical protein EDB86DRAFT_2920947 [Lactarius hatsudake]|nr:hypothetical protein EDB86DRAFT_2920947 [Lactarius hatsudake]